MKNICLVIFSLFFIFSAKSQETVVWGNEIIEVSSEFSAYDYSALQALHRPNVLPNGGENLNAWRPKSTNKEEFIMVSFGTPIKAKQVAIGESENPGAVKAVYGYDSDYNEYLLFELTPNNLPTESRLLNLFFETTAYEVEAIRVVLDCSISEGYNAIDAIGISSSNVPVNVLLDLVTGVNESLESNKLSENVNSDYVEHSPVVSSDGKRLYFSRQFHPNNIGGVTDPEDIWVSELDEETGEWLLAKNVGPPLNTKGPNFISSISVINGKEVLVLGNKYGKKGRMYAGASMSTREGDTFSEPTSMEIENEYNYSPYADFFLTMGGKVMIISAERDDTYGRRDLYVSFKKGNSDAWSEPLNMGETINSVGQDESPFMADDGRTLYFSSDGYSGYGGVDIYVSFKLDDTWQKWSKPENLGSGINKEGNEEYFSIPSSGKNLYFTRGEKGEDTDIFVLKIEDLLSKGENLLAKDEKPLLESSVVHLLPEKIMATIVGTVRDDKTKEPINGAIIFFKRLPDGLESSVKTDETGAFKLAVENGAKYNLVGQALGYASGAASLDFIELKESTTIEKVIEITAIEKPEVIIPVVQKAEVIATPVVKKEEPIIVAIQKNKIIEFKNIFFDFDKAKIKKASFPELNQVLKYLKDNSTDKVSILGHTDSVGPSEYNMILSKNRAQAVVNFFITNGISKDRLSSKGYGESKPKTSNDTPENRGKNRRVEFMIKE